MAAIEAGGLGGKDAGSSYTVQGVTAQLGIHLAFTVSAVALKWIDKQADHGSTKKPRKQRRRRD